MWNIVYVLYLLKSIIMQHCLWKKEFKKKKKNRGIQKKTFSWEHKTTFQQTSAYTISPGLRSFVCYFDVRQLKGSRKLFTIVWKAQELLHCGTQCKHFTRIYYFQFCGIVKPMK